MASDRIQRRIERLLDEADEAFAERNWPVVHANAQDVLRLDPENSEALTFFSAAKQALDSPREPEPPAPAAPYHIPGQPTSFANGRYEVKCLLGEGGKKRVYLAQDTLLDREVAFALIKTEGLDEVSRTRITRGPGHGPSRLPPAHRHCVRSWSRSGPTLHGHRADGRWRR